MNSNKKGNKYDGKPTIDVTWKYLICEAELTFSLELQNFENSACVINETPMPNPIFPPNDKSNKLKKYIG